MAQKSFPHTCLSTQEHNDRILDVTLHYFACLKVSERPKYFAGLSSKAKKRIRKEELRIEKLAAYYNSHQQTDGGITKRRFKESLRAWRGYEFSPEPEEKVVLGVEESVDADMKAAMIYFKNSRPYTVPGFENEFPNQKISIKELLADDGERNPLMWGVGEDEVRYFHFPANNMIWIEEAIARYYHEKRPNPDDVFLRARPQARTKTEMLLNPEFWLGQQLGDANSEVHARSMRPLCEVVSIDPVSVETMPKNLVLFMPYLHWETDRGRMRSANVIKEASKIRFSSLREVVDTYTAEQNDPPAQNDELSIQSSSNLSKIQTIVQRRAALGRTLRHAAKLAEIMDSHVDEKLIYECLHQNPPLHTRRTLDQSYYGALKNTQTRDRDQVVYRATTPLPHECDKICRREKGCPECQDDIRKLPRLIMVDQLWLWILDEKTIITSFPRRWGKNIADPSAVHKSIRARLKAAREDEIRSVFDLALIIADQCSRVFFDRTRSIDRQPNLVDIFADAIRGVTYKQTAAFDQFLTYTHLASKDHNSRDKPKSGDSAAQNTLLNINPEGKLLKEVKDILDELNIMTRIKLQQQIVAESFVKHIRHILLPKVASAADLQLALPSEASLLVPGSPDPSGTMSLRREQLAGAKWTLARADNLLTGIQNRISELNSLCDAATNTSAALKDLLTLKQQQAGVVEAREAVKQATETLKQGRSIMLFTIITIIFLPLSFCASIFGMNVTEFNGGLLTLHEELYYMFPTSVAIIITSFTFAFSSSSFVSAIYELAWEGAKYPVSVAGTWALTRTGMFTLSRELESKAKEVRDRGRKVTGTMRANALREKMEWKVARDLLKEESLETAGKGQVGDVESAMASSGSLEGRLYYSNTV